MTARSSLVRHAGDAALRVLHDDDRVDAEHVARQRQAAQHVVGDPPAGVADDVRLAEVQTEHGEHVDAGIHAGDHGEPAQRLGVAEVSAGRGVARVGAEEAIDLVHVGAILAAAPRPGRSRYADRFRVGRRRPPLRALATLASRASIRSTTRPPVGSAGSSSTTSLPLSRAAMRAVSSSV